MYVPAFYHPDTTTSTQLYLIHPSTHPLIQPSIYPTIHPPVHSFPTDLSIHLPNHLFTIHPRTFSSILPPSVHSSIFSSIYHSTPPSSHPPIRLSTIPFIHPPPIFPSTHHPSMYSSLDFHLPIHPFVILPPIYPLICLCISPFTCLFISK